LLRRLVRYTAIRVINKTAGQARAATTIAVTHESRAINETARQAAPLRVAED
jgi:hypothetical protein